MNETERMLLKHGYHDNVLNMNKKNSSVSLEMNETERMLMSTDFKNELSSQVQEI